MAITISGCPGQVNRKDICRDEGVQEGMQFQQDGVQGGKRRAVYSQSKTGKRRMAVESPAPEGLSTDPGEEECIQPWDRRILTAKRVLAGEGGEVILNCALEIIV